MSVLLTVICNASTEAVRKEEFPTDEPLDAQGHAKAAAFAAKIRRVDAAWTSPALRARRTTMALKVNATVDHQLRDIDFGNWSGRSLTEIAAADPDAVAAWTTNPAVAPHGGESIADVLHRIEPWLAAICRAEGRIVAVTHPAITRAVIILALDANPLSFWRIDAGPLSSVRLRGSAGRWTLLSVSSGDWA
jgi:broad specificity phosphatase PhoE